MRCVYRRLQSSVGAELALVGYVSCSRNRGGAPNGDLIIEGGTGIARRMCAEAAERSVTAYRERKGGRHCGVRMPKPILVKHENAKRPTCCNALAQLGGR